MGQLVCLVLTTVKLAPKQSSSALHVKIIISSLVAGVFATALPIQLDGARHA
jgi:hypothetical protein